MDASNNIADRNSAQLLRRLRDLAYGAFPAFGKVPSRWTGKHWVPAKAWTGFSCRIATDSELSEWESWPSGNIGIACGAIIGIDVDVLDRELAQRLLKKAQATFRTSIVRFGRSPKFLLPVRAEGVVGSSVDRWVPPGAGPDDKLWGLEILARGRQFIAFGIHPDTRKPYTWPRRSLLDVSAANLPLATPEQIAEIRAYFAQVMQEFGATFYVPSGATAGKAHADFGDVTADEILAKIDAGEIGGAGRWHDTALDAGLWCQRHTARLGDDGVARIHAAFAVIGDGDHGRTFRDGMKLATDSRGAPMTEAARDALFGPLGSAPVAARPLTVGRLLVTDFGEVQWVIPAFLPQGLILLAGKPKVGKSWLTASFALVVGAGVPLFDNLAAPLGDVLWLALEDPPRRLKDRLQIMGAPLSDRIEIQTSWRRLDQGGVDDLARWIDEHPDARLIIIDTLARVKPPARPGSAYDSDTIALGPLQRLASERGVAIVVVTHLRKAGAEDWADAVTGTLGITGVADATMVLTRERGKAVATLRATGRDLEEFARVLQFAASRGTWIDAGMSLAEASLAPEQRRIFDVLRAVPDGLTRAEIAAKVGKGLSATGHLLGKLADRGLAKPDGARWRACSR